MLTSILIIAFSLVLFAYWFRASCRLVLRNHAEQPVIANDRFSFQAVQAMLKTAEDLGSLHGLLNRDFQVLTYLQQHAANLEMGSFEDQLLILDFKLMRWYYRIISKVMPKQARTALSEMATVVGVLANKLGTQAEG
jgi:hypothetical protein